MNTIKSILRASVAVAALALMGGCVVDTEEDAVDGLAAGEDSSMDDAALGGAKSDPLVVFALPAAKRTVSVSNAQALTQALAKAQAGDHIVLENGTYTGTFKLAKSGTAAAPVVIRARNLHKAVVKGQIVLGGDYNWAHGMKFEGTSTVNLQIVGDYAVVLRNWFHGLDGVFLASPTSYYRIGCNLFDGQSTSDSVHSRHIYIKAPGALPDHGRIYRNYFHDQETSDSGGSMNIYVGDDFDPGKPSFEDTVIEYNLIDSGKRRLIYSKFGGTIQYNTIYADRGEFGFRGGDDGKMYGNYIDGVYEVMVHGTHHDLRGNRVVDSQINVQAEYLLPGNPKPRPAGDYAQLVGNEGKVVVGHYSSNEILSRKVKGVRIEKHTGSLVKQSQEGTIIQSTTSKWYPKAVVLTPSQVGPSYQP